jgi:hypothetical protein
MFTVALVTVAKLWKQPRCPTTDECIKKMWYLYTVEFYSAMKKNEILSFTGKLLEVKNTIFSEVSQLRSSKAACSPLHANCSSKTNASVLWETGHTKGRLYKGGIR